MKTKYKIFGVNHLFNASGFLPEVYETRAEALKGVKQNKWFMDDCEIIEVKTEEENQ